MWLIPFAEGEDHLVMIDLGREVQTSGLRIWNYNKSPEDTYRGVSNGTHFKTPISKRLWLSTDIVMVNVPIIVYLTWFLLTGYLSVKPGFPLLLTHTLLLW